MFKISIHSKGYGVVKDPKLCVLDLVCLTSLAQDGKGRGFHIKLNLSLHDLK